MSRSTLAICIPAYNAAEFLPRLLGSVNAQTVKFDEVWVYDDFSTDQTAKVAQELGARVVRGEVNRGCATGRNALAEQASCDWLHFHDADDALHPTFVERARLWMEQGDAPDIVLFGYEERDHETGVKSDERTYDDAALRRDAVEYTISKQVQSICGIYRRDLFLKAGGYDLHPEVLYNEDVAMHCRMARAGLKFAADHAVTVINYRRSNSMSSANQYKCSRAQYHVMSKAVAELGGRYNDEIAKRLWQIAAASASYLDWENADACVSLATSLSGRVPAGSGRLFRLLCGVSPHAAIRIREKLIRMLKPTLRTNHTAAPEIV
ncbi:MAG TPA: glycosyltransferase family 2 protein [Pyrinomonadaceae bacterium]|jgi:glycosyltransferase involved in cell wall biosynthesis